MVRMDLSSTPCDWSGPVVSALTNKFGCRPVAVAGSVIASAGFLIRTMAPSIDVLIVTYGIIGGKRTFPHSSFKHVYQFPETLSDTAVQQP